MPAALTSVAIALGSLFGVGFGGEAIGETSADAASPTGSVAEPTEFAPDLGVARFRDPHNRREGWIGADLGGVYVPEQVFDREVALLRPTFSWALALTESLAIGGRHSPEWWFSTNLRSRFHTHQLELSGRPSAHTSRLGDRLAATLEFRDLKRSVVGGTIFAIGGVQDVVVAASYGIEHSLRDNLRLGWQIQPRYVWVFLDTQRQVRGALRLAWQPRPRHELWFTLTGHVVHRDPDQFSKGLPRLTAHGQFAFSYTWMSRSGLGIFVEPRGATSFLSGESPIYEVRRETVRAPYADLTAGFRAVWR